jgi:hypothetical protein
MLLIRMVSALVIFNSGSFVRQFVWSHHSSLRTIQILGGRCPTMVDVGRRWVYTRNNELGNELLSELRDTSCLDRDVRLMDVP